MLLSTRGALSRPNAPCAAARAPPRRARRGAAAAAGGGAATLPSAQLRPLEYCRAGDLLECTMPDGGGSELLEVMEGWADSGAVVGRKGQLLRLAAAGGGGGGGALTLEPLGEPALRASGCAALQQQHCPDVVSRLSGPRAARAPPRAPSAPPTPARGRPPPPPPPPPPGPAGGYPAADGPVVSAFGMLTQVLAAMHASGGEAPKAVAAARVVDSLEALIARVEADPSFWCRAARGRPGTAGA
jgi:hypothetical protein